MVPRLLKKQKNIVVIAVLCCLICIALGVSLKAIVGSEIELEESKMSLANRMEAGEHKSKDGQDILRYRLYVPERPEENRTYPIVVWLHGAGGRGDDNRSHLDKGVAALTSETVQQVQRAFVLAPQCPDSHQWVEMEDNGPPYENYAIDEVPESAWFVLLLETIARLEKRYPIDVDRRYVAGFSMGAAGVWDIITRHPSYFAAAMSLAGKGDPSQAARLAQLPIWAFHGRFDPIAPISNTRSLAKAIAAAGGRKLKVTELWRKHYIVQHVFKNSEPFRWLFQQRRSSR